MTWVLGQKLIGKIMLRTTISREVILPSHIECCSCSCLRELGYEKRAGEKKALPQKWFLGYFQFHKCVCSFWQSKMSKLTVWEDSDLLNLLWCVGSGLSWTWMTVSAASLPSWLGLDKLDWGGALEMLEAVILFEEDVREANLTLFQWLEFAMWSAQWVTCHSQTLHSILAVGGEAPGGADTYFTHALFPKEEETQQ